MKKDTPITSRKDDHIQINLINDVESGISTGLEKLHFEHSALPEINFSDIDPSISYLGRNLKLPLLISSMTGGTPEGLRINHILAEAANRYGLAMGVGSQRVAIDHPETLPSFDLRQVAPNILLLANLGAAQLNYGYGVEECKQAVDSIHADGLILHLNPLHEALQTGGDTDFAGLLGKIEMVCRHLEKPVIVKEVGWGISTGVARQLMSAGISAIDVAGAGGTSWSQVEMFRTEDDYLREVALKFRSWGIPTAQAIHQAQLGAPGLPIIASGGLQSGVDIAKCIALGATLTGMAGPLLRTAAESEESLARKIEQLRLELTITMFVTGSPTLESLHCARFLSLDN